MMHAFQSRIERYQYIDSGAFLSWLEREQENESILFIWVENAGRNGIESRQTYSEVYAMFSFWTKKIDGAVLHLYWN